ncbi:hypothetical protein [Sphingobacterium sp. LRF_L2]|uniref:hypothetical protein n=1 Tax=Sphingobacterium sp. LRF_L2 TaxID=3369421 RepID=UPI003F647AD9
MKTITITLIIILLSSCRTYKEKVQQESGSYGLTEESKSHQYFYQWEEKDSLDRYLYFWTDTSFTYHADSGLRANSGYLWIREKGARASAVELEILDSTNDLKIENTYKTVASRKIVDINNWYILATLVALTAIFWFFKRSTK